MGDRVLQVDVREGVATPTLDPPTDRALSRAMRAPLRSALTEAREEAQEGIAAFREERPARRVPS